MDWKETYKDKVTSAETAIKAIKDGDFVIFSETAGIPLHVAKTLAEHREDYNDVKIYHMLALGDGDYMKPECYGHFRHITNFAGANSRQAIVDGAAEFFPCFFHEVPKLLGETFPVDVAVVTVTPPDSEGYCSFGVSCDYARPAAMKAKVVIAEMNDQLPRTCGLENRIHASQITYMVPCSYRTPEIPRPNITDVEKNIGRNCASLIKDGATLQLGIGAIPDAVAMFLKDKKDLGIHTEMFSDSVVDLVEDGVVNCAKKTLHPGKLIATFLMGTQKLYDFVDNNPMVELYPVDYVNDPWVIGKNDNMVAINSCLSVDFAGQVASETIGLKQYSGTGGQVDYVRGASLSKGGISIMAMPSTAGHGKISRIVPMLDQGAAVTTSRNEVDYVVTEYGVAKLKGRTLQQRAKNLVEIAHPDFREELNEELKKRFKI